MKWQYTENNTLNLMDGDESKATIYFDIVDEVWVGDILTTWHTPGKTLECLSKAECMKSVEDSVA